MNATQDLLPDLGAGSTAPDQSHSRQPYQIAVTSAFLAISIPAVVVRIWIRRWMINSLGVDDYLMVISLFSYLVYNAALMEIVANGGGTHLATTATTLRSAVHWLIINELFYLMTQIFLKLSLGYFFLRVVIKKGQRRFIYATIILSTVINFYHVLFVIFRCGDPRHYTENQLANKCVSSKTSVALSYEQAAVSTVTDIIFAAMPIPLLWGATMDLRSKISAGFILSLGAFGSICSIVRFLFVQNLAFTEDFFWSAVNISIWSTAELGTGIVAGSLATMRPLLKRLIRTTRNHITQATKQEKKPPTSKSSITKPPPIPDNLESLPSVFRPWESVGESGGYTTTCVGGSQIEKSMNGSKNKSIDILSSKVSDRAAIWPFVEDSSGIAKVVDVEVSVTETQSPIGDVDIERHPLRQHKVVLEGGGLWGVRMEDKIRRPERSATGTAQSASRSSTPEWERLPDLLPMDDLKRESSEMSRKTTGSASTPSNSSPPQIFPRR